MGNGGLLGYYLNLMLHCHHSGTITKGRLATLKTTCHVRFLTWLQMVKLSGLATPVRSNQYEWVSYKTHINGSTTRCTGSIEWL